MAQMKTKTTPPVQLPKNSSSKANSRLVEPTENQQKKLAQEALQLERMLEYALLQDAIYSARRALEELKAETRSQPHERRHGMRLREKADKVERAFNRLRALRRGDLLPAREPED